MSVQSSLMPSMQFPRNNSGIGSSPSGKASILNRPFMEFRPFGMSPHGEKIRDVSGMMVRANVEFLEERITQTRDAEAAQSEIQNLCTLLNQRICDPAYHVTPSQLRTIWNSYSYEFVCYLAEFCCRLSGDPSFQYHMGRQKFISSMIQSLGRRVPMSQIYKIVPHFGEKFTRGSILFHVKRVTDESAILGMKFTDHVYRQFGPYRRRCAELFCQSAKARLAGIPHHVHDLDFAMIHDRQCIANGDELCEWEFHWTPQTRQASTQRPVWPILIGGSTLGYLRWSHPDFSWSESLVWSMVAGSSSWIWANWMDLGQQAAKREALLKEQIAYGKKRREALWEAYLEQERTNAELNHKVGQLTTLHQTGLPLSSTLDRESFIQCALDTILQKLPYDRAMLAFFDRKQAISYDARILGANENIARFARTLETPITDPNSIEGQVLLQGKPLLIGDVNEIWDRLHPIHQRLARMAKVKSFICVPLTIKGRILGSLTVDRNQEHALTQDDVHLVVTVGNQVATALDNAQEYHKLKKLNASLKSRMQDQTDALQQANCKLQELNQLKSAFLSIVSHELRTPMTSIKGLVENLLDGFIGGVNERQAFYLTRIKHNIERLSRMLDDLLDFSRIENGRMELTVSRLSLLDLVSEVTVKLKPLADSKFISISNRHLTKLPPAFGDRDKVVQVLTNLVHNAIKFTPPRRAITIEATQPSAPFVQICVVDQGPGIPPEDLTNIFERFYQTPTRSTKASGAGLGLTITKSLVELNQGKIWVESEVGKGTRFSFTLPTQNFGEKPVRLRN